MESVLPFEESTSANHKWCENTKTCASATLQPKKIMKVEFSNDIKRGSITFHLFEEIRLGTAEMEFHFICLH